MHCYFYKYIFAENKSETNDMAKKNLLTTADYLPYSEYERLIKSLHEDNEYVWELYALVSFCTALRSSDVLNLKWADVLHKENMLVKEKKTSKIRSIKINPEIKRRIENLYVSLKEPDLNTYIFYSTPTNSYFTVQYVNKKLKYFKYRYNLKVGNFSTHTFRKTLADMCMKKTIKVLKALYC